MLQYPNISPTSENISVIKAGDMGFTHGHGSEFLENSVTLHDAFRCTHRVKFILAQKQDIPRYFLGVFYPTQSLAPSAIALCHYLAGKTDEFPTIAKNSFDISYGSFVRSLPKLSPIIEGTEILGGGEIHTDRHHDQASSFTLENSFGIKPILHEHMQVIRDKVLEAILPI